MVNLLNEAKNESNHLNEVDVSSEIYKDLSHMVGKERVSESNLDRLLYSHDLAPLPKEMSLAFKTIPDIVVKPRDAIDVSRIMKYAVENDIPVIPRGGATWAFGGAVPAFGGIVLDIGSMQEILDINKENLFVTVEPGINWKKLYDTLLSKDLLIGAYPSSAPGASVGGWVNTGGVGVGSYKYGGIDQLIRSLEVVLSDGTIITTGCKNVLNNSSGYNLTDLFIGSEGTLGIITKVTLKVFPAPEEIRPTSF
ncbi:MAG: FAD-binding oxidoreductase, partial [Thermoplasmatales archaeon]